MHRVQQIIRVALFVVALLGSLAAAVPGEVQESRQAFKCMKMARNVMINNCKGEPVMSKVKRSVRKLDLAGMEKELKIDASDFSLEEPHVSQQKRQWGMGPYSGTGLYPGMGPYPGMRPMPGMVEIPGMGVEAANNYQNTDIETPLFDFQSNKGFQAFQEQVGPGAILPMPYGPMGMYPMPRAAVIPDKFLGYELSPEELEEIHAEISERMPRESKYLTEKIVDFIAKCCSNVTQCMDNPSVVPCM
nr:uncharacterized protein LOC117222135 [Megalopta genalis]